MTRAPTQPTAIPHAPPQRPDPIAELDHALRDLVADHEALLTLARAHREAIAKADVSAMHRCLDEQQQRLQRIRGHEFRRQAAVFALQGSTSPDSGRLSALAQRAAEPVRSRLISLGERLRELLNSLQNEHQAARQAAETLSSHMEGLMRQVCRHLSHAGTYGRTAAIDTRTPVVTVLDLRR